MCFFKSVLACDPRVNSSTCVCVGKLLRTPTSSYSHVYNLKI